MIPDFSRTNIEVGLCFYGFTHGIVGESSRQNSVFHSEDLPLFWTIPVTNLAFNVPLKAAAIEPMKAGIR